MRDSMQVREGFQKELAEFFDIPLEDAANRCLSLTNREYEVAQYLSRGNKNKTIAEKMGISPKTLDIHRANVFRKMGTKSPVRVAHIFSVGVLAAHAEEEAVMKASRKVAEEPVAEQEPQPKKKSKKAKK